MARTKAGLALGYAEADRPFADPVFWAAFVLVGT
jgi:CHAT domain-containing protein